MCVPGGGREEGVGEERHALRTAHLRPSHRPRRRMLGGEPATGCNGIRRLSLGPNGGRLHWSANGRAQAVACQSIHPQRQLTGADLRGVTWWEAALRWSVREVSVGEEIKKYSDGACGSNREDQDPAHRGIQPIVEPRPSGIQAIVGSRSSLDPSHRGIQPIWGSSPSLDPAHRGIQPFWGSSPSWDPDHRGIQPIWGSSPPGDPVH